MKNLITSLKLLGVTIVICCVIYPLAVLAFAQTFAPETSNGSLLKNRQGSVIGSRLVAQSFSSPGYFWPRPSAADYNASGAGGSNLSPGSPAITARASALIEAYGVTDESRLPADLVTASGSGLDPHISIVGALYQVPRIAGARGLNEQVIADLVENQAFAAGGIFSPNRIVNVLEINLALDALIAK